LFFGFYFFVFFSFFFCFFFTARATVGPGLAVSAFPRYVPV
jgi:hypothetical protein